MNMKLTQVNVIIYIELISKDTDFEVELDEKLKIELKYQLSNKSNEM